MCHQHLQLHRVDINNFGQIVANKIIYLVMTMQYCIPCFPHTKRWVFTGLSRLIVTATLIDVEIADDAATSQVTSFPNQTDRIRIKQSRVDRRVRPENIQLSTFDQPSQPWPTNMQSSSHKGWRTIAKKKRKATEGAARNSIVFRIKWIIAISLKPLRLYNANGIQAALTEQRQARDHYLSLTA